MVTAWRDEALETELLGHIMLDHAWELVELFSTLTRLSGSEEEALAVRHITEKLRRWDIPFEVYHPTCLISLPGPATLRTLGPNGRSYRVKTTSFARATGGAEVEAELVYLPGQQAASSTALFEEQRNAAGLDLRGKVVMTEGMGIAARGFDLAESGAVAALFISPGENIHEGITTTSWGSPDLDSLERTAPIPIITINSSDGRGLIEQLGRAPVRVAFSNQVDTGWRPIPVIVAELVGADFPEEFVLLHGHLDSWHVGVGDNATGDATLLELARVFRRHQRRLRRSLRIAWWSGHSHGRYAGSTWYADAFALELVGSCVAHVNCDSPGCRWATVYHDVSWMSEAEAFCQQTIRDLTGMESTGEGHVLRAGDCSFNNLGVTTFFMLSSTMPAELLAEKGYYPVGGCGGNIAWHTEDDTLEIADRDNLLRDMQVYAAAVLRTLNAPVAPFDYRATVAELRETLERYQAAAADGFDFADSFEALDELNVQLDGFYERCAELTSDAPERALRQANAGQRALARILVSLGYTKDGRFKQDPARGIPALPELAPALDLANADADLAHAIRIQLQRGQNRLLWELGQAIQIAGQRIGA